MQVGGRELSITDCCRTAAYKEQGILCEGKRPYGYPNHPSRDCYTLFPFICVCKLSASLIAFEKWMDNVTGPLPWYVMYKLFHWKCVRSEQPVVHLVYLKMLLRSVPNHSLSLSLGQRDRMMDKKKPGCPRTAFYSQRPGHHCLLLLKVPP